MKQAPIKIMEYVELHAIIKINNNIKIYCGTTIYYNHT